MTQDCVSFYINTSSCEEVLAVGLPEKGAPEVDAVDLSAAGDG